MKNLKHWSNVLWSTYRKPLKTWEMLFKHSLSILNSGQVYWLQFKLSVLRPIYSNNLDCHLWPQVKCLVHWYFGLLMEKTSTISCVKTGQAFWPRVKPIVLWPTYPKPHKCYPFFKCSMADCPVNEFGLTCQSGPTVELTFQLYSYSLWLMALWYLPGEIHSYFLNIRL